MGRFGNNQRLGARIDGLQYSESVPWVDEAIGEEHPGESQVESAVVIIGELNRSFDECIIELTAEYVDALLYKKVAGKVLAKWLSGVVTRLEESKLCAGLVGPQTA